MLVACVVREAQSQGFRRLCRLFGSRQSIIMATMMVEDFVLPPGATFPSPEAGIISADRPRRRSIDTPALKLDTAVVVAVTERVDFPPPPKRKPDSTKAREKSGQSPAKKEIQRENKNPNNVSMEDKTPVMRSIFPKFEARDAQRPAAAGRELSNISGAHYSPSLYSQPSSPPPVMIASDSRTESRLSSAFFSQHPQRFVGEEQVSDLSTIAQLSHLWDIATGKDTPEALPTYDLALKW